MRLSPPCTTQQSPSLDARFTTALHRPGKCKKQYNLCSSSVVAAGGAPLLGRRSEHVGSPLQQVNCSAIAAAGPLLSPGQSEPIQAAAGLCAENGGNSNSGGSGGNRGPSRRVGEADDDGDNSNSNHHNNRRSSGQQYALLQQLLSAVLPAALLQLSHTPAAAAAGGGRSKLVSKQDEHMLPAWEIDAFVDRMWDLSGPILSNMGFSGVLGAAAAAAFKWVGRTLAASVGVALILVQVLSYNNYISVNWSVVHKQAQQVLDRTGDGRLDKDDFKRYIKKGMIMLSEGVPSVSGFLVGFAVGLKVF